MQMRHLRSVIAAFVASVMLSGCYVYSTVPPAPNGPVVDERLVGTWVGLDEKGKPVANAFLHFIIPKDDGPFRMISSQTDDFGVFDLHTVKLPGRRAFAVRKVYPAAPAGSKVAVDDNKYMLGVYDIRGDKLVIRILLPEKLRPFVHANKVKGIVEPGTYGDVTLTGSPDEVTRFLVSPEAEAALGETHTLARRLPPQR